VKLSHECYEDISFKAGINKDKREVFDMGSYLKLKKGGLVLNAEKNGEPVSELVYANGKQIGETPFSGTVPICAGIELGKSREKVEVKLKPNENISHTVKIGSFIGGTFTDARDGKKYKTTKIGDQTWMAENLNYNASGSKCYENKESNCKKYGRLYNSNTAMNACPKGWHLPSKAEWEVLTASVGGEDTEGKYLKAKSGWNSDKGKSGNGLDKYGFSALPGGLQLSASDGYFSNVGRTGYWWSASKNKNYNDNVYLRVIRYDSEGANWTDEIISFLLSVRCLKD